MSRHHAAIFLSASLFLVPATLHADAIQMLPPVQSNSAKTEACSANEGNKILSWDGARAIKCNANVTVDDNGNVGIGVQSPQAVFHVKNPNSFLSVIYDGKHYLENGTDHILDMILGRNTDTGKYWDMAVRGPYDATIPNGLVLAHFSNALGNNNSGDVRNWTWGLTIDQNGNVGVGPGAYDPNNRLSIYGTVNSIGTYSDGTPVSGAAMNYRAYAFDAGYSSQTIDGYIHQLIGTYSGWDRNSIYIAGYNSTNSASSSTKSVSFGGWGDGTHTAGSPTMFVDLVNHKVGINNVVPIAALDVTGTIKSSSQSNSYSVSLGTLTGLHSGCTGNAVNANGAFTAWCVAACNRFCRNIHYSGGTITEYDGGGQMAMCGCMP